MMRSGSEFFFALAYAAGLRGLRQQEGISGEVFDQLGLPMVVQCTACEMTHVFFATFIEKKEGSRVQHFFCRQCAKQIMRDEATAKPPALAADPRVSPLANELLKLRLYANEASEDVHAFGAPSECTKLVWESCDRLAAGLFTAHKMSQMEFDLALAARISHKSIYNLGLYVMGRGDNG